MDDESGSSRCRQMVEADHRITNHLAILGSYVRLKGSELLRRETPPDRLDISLLLKAIGVQIEAIAQLHRILSADGSQGSADLGEHLGLICSSLRSGVAQEVVILESFGSDCTLPLCRILPAAQIITEVITNAIKHGRRPGAPGAIEVACRKDAEGTITVDVRDSGPGMSDDDRARTAGGLGFRLVQGLVGQIGGTIEYLSCDDGLGVRLTLPRMSVGAAAPGPGVKAILAGVAG